MIKIFDVSTYQILMKTNLKKNKVFRFLSWWQIEWEKLNEFHFKIDKIIFEEHSISNIKLNVRILEKKRTHLH